MNDKPYRKFTLEQFKALSEFVREVQHLAPTLERAFREAGSEKLASILGDNFSWSHFYEMPFNEHLGWCVVVMGWQDVLKNAAAADDPQQAFMEFAESADADKEWNGGFEGRFQKKDLFAVIISISKSIKSIMTYQKSLSVLVEEVSQGSEQALFDAVRIDRSIMACTPVRHRISIAEMKNDQKFFQRLKKSLKGPSKKHMVALDPMRYMMQALIEIGADHLNGENLEQLFVEHSKLYPRTPGAQKNLIKHYSHTKKINHRK